MDQNRNLRLTVFLCLALGLATLAVFWPTLGHAFLTYDDQQYVTENPHVQAGLTWRGVGWALRSNEASNWHPVTWLSHMLDCQLYGLKPAGHHLTNLVLHIANTLLLFLLLRRLTGAVWRSALVAALFACHPLHVQSVAWVAERKDVLSAFFWLLTLWSYAWYVAAPRFSRYLIPLVLFAVGLMAKPMVVTLPFVLLLLDFWPLRRIADWGLRVEPAGQAGGWSVKQLPLVRLVWEKMPFFALSAISCGLTLWAQGAGHAIVSGAQLPLMQRLPHALVSYVEYIGKAIVPARLAVFYPYLPVAWWQAAAAGIVLTAVSILALRFRARRPYFLMGWLWFLGVLLPVIGLVQAGDQAMADRYTYLPFVGLFVLIVWGAAEIGGGSVPVKILWVVILLAAAVDCNLELRYWKNTRALFTHAAQVTKRNYVAAAMLGSLLAEDGNYLAATDLYAEALSYNPDFPEAHFYLGAALDKQGRLDDAMAEYSTALRLRPRFEQAHVFLGIDLAREQKIDLAAAQYLEALKINPDSAVAHNDLAKLFHGQGRLAEAAEHYQAALRLDPKLAPAHNNLGVVLLQQGRAVEGASELQEALRLYPDNLETQANLARAFNQGGRWDEAIALCANLAHARPKDADVFYQWGLALAHRRQMREALARLAHALLLNQEFPDALNELAWILATDPQPDYRNGPQAVILAEHACELTRKQQPAMLLTLAAAYAENGRFAEAIATAEKARELASSSGSKELTVLSNDLLEKFRAGQPYRGTEK